MLLQSLQSALQLLMLLQTRLSPLCCPHLCGEHLYQAPGSSPVHPKQAEQPLLKDLQDVKRVGCVTALLHMQHHHLTSARLSV